MRIIETEIDGLLFIEPKVFSDERGCFFESDNDLEIKKLLPNVNFLQDNEAMSSIEVLWGLHFQTGEYAQAKLVRVMNGSVLYIAVDLRRNSSTYGRYFSIELYETNKKLLFMPRGFAPGYLALVSNSIIHCKCDNYNSPENEYGILWNDPALNINWQLNEQNILLSEKDKSNPLFEAINRVYID